MSRKDDGALADRLLAGDPSAFRDLIEAYQRKVYGLAYEMTRNHADAEDISQVAFMKIHRAIRTLEPGRGLNAWVYRIAYRTALDHLRKKPFYPRAAAASLSQDAFCGEPPDPATGPEAAAEAAGLRRRLDDALARISRRERTAIVLRHYHDLKVQEIAETLGISLGAAKSYLFRALRKLHKELARTGTHPELDEGERR